MDFHITFLHGHGQFSDKLYRKVQAECGAPSRTGWRQTDATDGSTVLHVGIECSTLLAEMENEVGGYYSYNLYDECWYENIIAPSPSPRPLLSVDGERATVTITRSDRARHGRAASWAAAVPSKAPGDTGGHGDFGGALNDYACGGPVVQVAYLGLDAVKKALHVPTDAVFFQCDNGEGFNYHGDTPALMPFYRHVVEETGLRVLIYNGDADPGLNSFYAQNWTAALGYSETEEWRPWTIDGKEAVGGYVTRYEHDFDFLTIRGAGHMVPQYQSRTSLEFITRWLRNEPYQAYKRQPKERRAKPQ